MVITPINGMLLLDKPVGITSNAALQQVKRALKPAVKKAGYVGTLDPLASGVLPICLGKSTKLAQYLSEADKQYAVTMRLGIRTTTGDAEGEIQQVKPVPAISESLFLGVLKQFQGRINQVPPMYSAIKHKGIPLYRLARRGITVERASRCVNIYDLSVTHRDAKCFGLIVRCSKGTYIRTLVEDIGDALNCGAHVISLRRLMVGQYGSDRMVNLIQLKAMLASGSYSWVNEYIYGMDKLARLMPTEYAGHVQ